MSGIKKKYTLNTESINIKCSSWCAIPKLSSIFNPKPARKQPNRPRCYDTNSSTFSDSTDTDMKKNNMGLFGKIDVDSVAEEKDSYDPYIDFRRSMLQMILENEIYSKDDLRELLNCFLQLNSPDYHGIIVRAFMEIWNGGAGAYPQL